MLSETKLQDLFTTLFDPEAPSFVGFEPDPRVCAQRFAEVFEAFALTAEDAAGNAILGFNTNAMATVLGDALVSSNTPATAAAAFALSVAWGFTGTTFELIRRPLTGLGGTGVFSVITQNSVTGVNEQTLRNYLEPEFATLGAAAAKMHGLAEAFYQGVRASVTVTTTGLDTSPTPVPIVFVEGLN